MARERIRKPKPVKRRSEVPPPSFPMRDRRARRAREELRHELDEVEDEIEEALREHRDSPE